MRSRLPRLFSYWSCLTELRSNNFHPLSNFLCALNLLLLVFLLVTRLQFQGHVLYLPSFISRLQTFPGYLLGARHFGGYQRYKGK